MFITMKNTVNTRIGLLKNKFNLDSKQFVAKTNISPTTLWSIEKGADLKPKTVKLIADAFGVNYHWLMTGEGEMMAEPKDLQFQNTPWRDEAYNVVKTQLERLQKDYDRLLTALIDGRLGKHKALNSTGFSKRKLLRAQA